jgi:hypothetical protein
MGQTRVDLLHLLEDLRDAYTGALEETILTEIVANSLDSGARSITIDTSPAEATLTVTDDGSGMQRRELSRYHDIAASGKTRGQGIGFAGVGIKLGLLLCEDVITETRRGKTHVATQWNLASKYRAPWKWVSPPGRVAERGTSVTLHLQNPLSLLLDAGYIESTLRRHYQTLFDPAFRQMLAPQYGSGIVFHLNGRALGDASAPSGECARLEIKIGRKRKPSAVGYLLREPLGLPEERRGLAISTLGKVIKRGWDWLGLSPALPETVEGLIEGPGMAACLTLSKADFVRTGVRGATYLAYRRAIQEAVGQQLAAWGDARSSESERLRRVARPIERDLEQVLLDMAEDFPLLGSLVEHRKGGQRKLPMGLQEGPDGRLNLAAAMVGKAVEPEESAAAMTATEGKDAPANETTDDGVQPARSTSLPPPGGAPGSGIGPRRPQRYGLRLDFESRPDDSELGRLVESTVWINEAHPAYRRAQASRSEGYHLALAVALALAPLAAEAADQRTFITSFLARWGESLEKSTGRKGAGRGRRTSRRG